MKKTEQVFIAVFIWGIMFSFYHICSNLLADVIPMTDEEYARAAQELVSKSLLPCQASTDISTGSK